MAQLGRPPTNDSGCDEKLVLLKSSRRVVRLPHGAHVAHDTPSQVPNIPTPIISYQSYDVTPLAGKVKPLMVVEKIPGDLTLHYVLEHFYGLYDNSKIMDKVGTLLKKIMQSIFAQDFLIKSSHIVSSMRKLAHSIVYETACA